MILEGTLSQDVSTLSAYLQTWRLNLSHTKTVMAAFHLNNREAKRELKVYNNGRLLPFCPTLTYLGVKLDRLLTFGHHTILVHHIAEVTRGLVLKHSCLLSLVWSTQQLSTVHQSGVAVLILASLAVS